MRILIVEDERLVRQVIVGDLMDSGFEVIEAGTGAEAIRLFREVGADLLFTDIRLPGPIDGWAVAEHLRSLDAKLPVVYATGYSDVEPRNVAGSLFLRKPYRGSHVVRAIRQLTGGE